MSLIHWFPLNGDIKDYGVDRFTIGNTPSFNANGKIGKCATNSSLGVGRTYLTSQYLPLTKTSPISMFAWVYMNAYTQTDATSALNGLVSNHNHSSNSDKGSGFGLNLWNNGSSFKVAVSTASTNGRTWTTYRGNTAFYTGAWHHVGFTYDGSRINFYLDGNYDGGVDFTTSYDSNNQIGIFCWSTGYAQYVGDYQLNDVRIYNHALSKKEIKEISKGLVVHYNFEEGVDNLLKNTSRYMYSSKLSRTSEAKDGWSSIPLYYNSLVSGKTYTLSVECDGLLNSSHSGSATNDPSKRLFTIWLYFHNTDYTDSDYSRYTIPICFTSTSYNHKQIDSAKHQWTFVLGTDIAYYKCCAVRVNTYSNGSTPITVNFWNFKLEENTTSTVWKPNFADTQYTSLGYNMIPDNSGYNNTATVYGTDGVQMMTNSPSGENYVHIPFASTIRYLTNNFDRTDCLTYSLWFRHYGPGTDNQTYLFTNGRADAVGYGYGVRIVSDTQISCFWGNRSIVNINVSKKEWHLLTVSITGLTQTIYLDGVQKATGTASELPTYQAGTGLGLGCFYYNTTGVIYKSECDIANFKIYATALSADDIKAEYQRKASLDNQGNLYTGMFKENGSFLNTKVNKNNTITSDNFAENIVLDDGSVWIPIVIHNVEEGLFSTTNKTYLYDNYNRWNSFGTINSIPRPENGWYEFLVMHQTVVNGTYRWWRFKQNVNPLTATWAQVNPSNVGTNVIRISSNVGAYGAGMYWFNDSKCPMCFANSSNGNWFGCGITTYHQGGIPGYNNEVVNGFQLVYMRTSKPQTKLFKKALLKANNIIEI